MQESEQKVETGKKQSKSISRKEFFSFFTEVIKTIGLIALIFVLVRYYIAQPFLVVGSSMEPSFFDNEYIIVNELSYQFTAPKRGDVVVFKHPDEFCTSFVGADGANYSLTQRVGKYVNRTFFQGSCKNYIKRVIGLPGETVTIKEGSVTITNNENPQGFVVDEKSYTNGIKLFGNQTAAQIGRASCRERV